MQTCFCCGPTIEDGIPGYLNFQEQQACQQTVSKGKPLQTRRANKVQQSIEMNAGRLFLSGVLARANTVTTNNRVYAKETLVREAQRYKENLVEAGTAFGELEHPSYSSPTFKQLHLATLSHQVISMFWHQDELHGVIEVLNTPAGRLVRGLYCQGLMFGASTRGYSGVFNPEAGQLYSVVGTDLVIFSFDLLMIPGTSSYLAPVRERIHIPEVQSKLQDKLVRAANRKDAQDVIEQSPRLNIQACKHAATIHAEMQAMAEHQEAAASTSDRFEAEAIADVPRRSLGTSISDAVKDVKEHLHLKSSSSTGYESLLTKHRTSSSEMPFEDSQAATIKARYGGETLRRRSSTGMSCMPISPLQDTKDRLYKVQKLLQLLQHGNLDWSGAKVQRDTERFLERALNAQPKPIPIGPAVSMKNPAPPLRAVPELQSLLSTNMQRRTTDGDSREVAKGGKAEKVSNGYAPLKERTMSQGEYDDMQLLQAMPLKRVPEMAVKQQLQGQHTRPRPLVS